jgi:hypothetical protein
MSQDDGNVANSDGATVRADMNSQLGALFTHSSGATAPSTTFAFQTWADTGNDLIKQRNAANSAWITLYKASTGELIVGADVASATALPVVADGRFADVTGTTTFTSMAALGIGVTKYLQFDGIVTVTHHSTNLVLPAGRNITTVAGQVLGFYEYAAGDWRLIFNSLPSIGKHTIYIPASGMRPTTSNGAASITDTETTAGNPDITGFAFDANADEHVQFTIGMPKSWNLGTVTAQFYWESTAADTDGVTWGLQGVAISDNQTIDAVFSGGTPQVIDDANQSAAEELLITSETPAITIGGTPADDDLCFFRAFRDVSDANDTATEDATLIGIKLFMTLDAQEDT